MILYIIGFIILLVMLFFIYIRIRYRFWALQPVFHFYDIYYWCVNVGIIRHELPEKNRYTNFKQIETLQYNKVSAKYINDFTHLISNNYLRNKDNTYSPEKENITPYFESHNSKTFWSFYWEPNVLVDNKTGALIDDKRLIGTITSRPLHIEIINKGETFDVNYIDFLCVDKNFRKKNIAPQLIQTHEYNQCHLNPKICVSLFKREEELTGIVPITVYTTFCFNMRKWNQPLQLEPQITLLVGDKQNIYYLYNFIVKTKYKWDISILPEMSNLMELVSTNNIYVTMLVLNGEIEAAYIFRKTNTYIEKNKSAISCISSIKGDTISNDIFIHGFKNSLWNIKAKSDKYAYLLIENLSDNWIIIDNIMIKTAPEIKSPTAYFFYNFAYHTFKSKRVLIIN
jgi:hypothetical protein